MSIESLTAAVPRTRRSSSTWVQPVAGWSPRRRLPGQIFPARKTRARATDHHGNLTHDELIALFERHWDVLAAKLVDGSCYIELGSDGPRPYNEPPSCQ